MASNLKTVFKRGLRKCNAQAEARKIQAEAMKAKDERLKMEVELLKQLGRMRRQNTNTKATKVFGDETTCETAEDRQDHQILCLGACN